MSDTIAVARHLVDLGLVLTSWSRSTGKGPVVKGWNHPDRVIDSREKASTRVRPGDQLGVVHEFSGTGALDVDRLADSRALLAAERVNLDLELAVGLRILSPRPGSAKLLFRMPTGAAAVQRKAVKVPGQALVAYELRGGLVQDVLPPSVHPLGPAYQWSPAPPRTRTDIPIIPPALLALWLRELASTPSGPPVRSPLPSASGEGASVIEAFNAAYSVTRILEAHGYRRHGNRWVCPSSSTGLAGVVAVDRGIYSHHGSDPLGNGHAHDAFSAYVHLEHRGNLRAAVRAAADLLGMHPPAVPINAERIDRLQREYAP